MEVTWLCEEHLLVLKVRCWASVPDVPYLWLPASQCHLWPLLKSQHFEISCDRYGLEGTLRCICILPAITFMCHTFHHSGVMHTGCFQVYNIDSVSTDCWQRYDRLHSQVPRALGSRTHLFVSFPVPKLHALNTLLPLSALQLVNDPQGLRTHFPIIVVQTQWNPHLLYSNVTCSLNEGSLSLVLIQ